MSSVVAGVALAAFASVLFNLAIVIQAQEAREVHRSPGVQISLIVRLLRRPRWLLGTALGLIAFPLQTIALLWAPLTAVQPADAAHVAKRVPAGVSCRSAPLIAPRANGGAFGGLSK